MRLPRITRRRFLSSTFAAGAGSAIWMRFFEPWWVRESHISVPLGLGELKLLHLSDLHAEPMPLGFLREQIDRALAWNPDFICVTGDFITTKYERWDEYAAMLAKLSAAAPTFASLGNHDGGRWARFHGYSDTSLVRSMLERANIALLHNAQERLEIRGRALRLVGLGDDWANEVEPVRAFGRGPSTVRDGPEPVIVLSHNPDTKEELAPFAWDLMLCGHTHGGQLSLPVLGEPFLPVRDKRFVRGLYRWESRWIHITAGLGSLHKARFNCRPEISYLTLT
ncbi:MAG: hypothetical protein RL088_242 [Verrucomicrobiota bacterium]